VIIKRVPTAETPVLRVTNTRAGFYEYFGPFPSRDTALDAARAIARLQWEAGGRDDLRYELDNGGPPNPPGYFEDIAWEQRQGEWWPAASMWSNPQ
jgi:hypothetical protein